MATLTVYAGTNDGVVRSDNADYATARSTAYLTDNASTTSYVGQIWTGAVYRCLEFFLSFDTSAIPANAIVTSATLSLYSSTDASDTDFTFEVTAKDWGTTLTNADWVAGADLSSTLLATYASSAWPGTGQYAVFTSESGFPAAIVKGGTTSLMIASSRQRAGNQPTGNEYTIFFTADDTDGGRDPRLVVEYSVGGLTVIRPVS